MFRISLLDWTYKGLARDDGEETFLFSQARLLTSLAASTLNLFVIICLNKVNAFFDFGTKTKFAFVILAV